MGKYAPKRPMSCALESCGAVFVATSARQRYCSRHCRDVEYNGLLSTRRSLATDARYLVNDGRRRNPWKRKHPHRADGTFARTMPVWTPELWDSGTVNRRGYFIVYRPDYPRARMGGYAPRYHVVWWLATGFVPPECIHHKDENKVNDRFDNLEAKSHADHTRDHFRLPPILRVCGGCGGQFEFARRDKDPARGKYCSQACYHAAPRKEGHKRAISAGLARAHREGRR